MLWTSTHSIGSAIAIKTWQKVQRVLQVAVTSKVWHSRVLQVAVTSCGDWQGVTPTMNGQQDPSDTWPLTSAGPKNIHFLCVEININNSAGMRPKCNKNSLFSVWYKWAVQILPDSGSIYFETAAGCLAGNDDQFITRTYPSSSQGCTPVHHKDVP